ncbi:YVTN repeat-like/Quino protein amine dehydrogenase, partial [Imleria badia]
MDVGDHIWDMAVSRDGKWVVSGTSSGLVTVWNAKSHEKASEFTGKERLWAVDVSPDGTKIATGSDLTACVWSLSGQRLLGPLEHNYLVAGVKFSPNGCLIATAARQSISASGSVRIYDSQNGRLLIDTQIQPSPCNKQFFAWAADSKWLFILSCGAIINCLDVSTGTILSQWPIHTRDRPGCIAVAPNGRFIAASAAKSVSFWDTRTHKKIGSIIKHKTFVRSIAISNDDIATSASTTITLMRLGDILPSEYLDVMARDEEILSMGVQGTNPKDIIKLSPAHDGCSSALSRIQGEGVDLEETNQSVLAEIYDLRAQNESLHKVIATLENTVQELRTDLAVLSATQIRPSTPFVHGTRTRRKKSRDWKHSPVAYKTFLHNLTTPITPQI